MPYKKLVTYIFILTAFCMHNVSADQRITLGVKLLAAGWQGNNGSVSNSFNSDEGGQLGFSVSYLQDKFYTGISLQKGNYNFSGDAPDQFTPGGRISSSNVEIEHEEFDLLAGYYFWEKVSLFLDLKGVSNTWSNDGYEQNFGGLGFGASTYIAFNNNWTGFSSAGFVGNGDIKDGSKVKVGEGRSGAIDFIAIYRLAQNSTLNMGLKFRSYKFEYLDDTNQNYSINALFVGYNHNFSF